MKICLFAISNFLQVQGSTEPYYVWRHLCRRHEVTAFVPNNNWATHLDRGVYQVRRVKHVPTFISYNLLVIPYLLKFECKSTELIYTYKGAVTPVLISALLFRKKWVCDFQTSPMAQEIEFRQLRGALSPWRRLAYFFARWFYRLTLRRCDLVVAISEEVKQELVQQYGVQGKRVFVLPLGVNPEIFNPKGKRPGIQEEGLRLVYTGAIAPQRGLDTVIHALAHLKEKILVKLVILGRGSQATVERLQVLSEQLNVSDMIEWKGFVPHERVADVLDTCHVALSPLPPLRAYEVSSPAKVVEYLAMGLNVIATDIIAHRKIIQHEESGLLVPPQDPEALARAIERLYHDADLRSHLEKQARESVKPYCWEDRLGTLERRLEALMR